MNYFLKYVEIDNFKSYKGHIVIGPLRKFTAIIGPNGSGKSNLMDAISFVLGEPTKSLRVRKLSELIHGAPINKPVSNRASVGLVFVSITSNESGDRSEHEKRFQRFIIGNASEYRVDGRQLSAAEYNEELENMGIIPKAKNFLIFQGQVESIAMKTPKEFTAMFEELSRSGELREEYEQAKQEKNKAEHDTHANFQKKKGVEKQKKEVRLEKEVAQKYAALKSQYDELQLQLKLFQLYHNKQELIEKRDIAEKKRDEVMKLEKRKEISDDEIKNKKKELAICNKELATDEQKIKELEAQINKNRPTYIKAKENSAHHQKKLDLAKKTLLAAEKTHAAHGEEVEKYEADLREVERYQKEYEDKLQDESQSIGRNLALEENQMKEYRRLKEEASQLMTQFSEEYDSVDRQQQVDRTNLEQEQRSQRDHMARIKQTESRIDELNGKIDKLAGYMADLERELGDKQASAQLLEREVTDGRRRCTELEEELDQVNKEMGEARSDRNETSRAQRRAELIENLKQFPGVYGRLIDLCEPTHKRFQMAITKVLGRNMDSIIVERETTVQSCLRYMKEHRYEPETFLPLDYIKVSPINEQLRELQDPKNVKLVLDVIKYDRQYYKALLYACGNALVCDNDDDARRLAYESGGQKYKVVSLNGTLFSKSGVISGGSSELKARAKRWDEKHLDGLRMRKDKLFDEYKEQQKKKRREAELINARAQLQQLESRLRYSRTDKETAEKKLRILIEKDLLDFQGKLAQYDPRINALQASIGEREKVISKLRMEKNKIEDVVFVEFCKQIHVANIRVYEDRELQAAEKRAQERLEFENQKTKIQTMLEFERSRDTDGHVEQITQEVTSLEDALQRCQKNEKKYRKIIEDLQHEIADIKDRLIDHKKKIEFQDRDIADCTKRAAQLNKDYNEQRKRLQLIDSDIEKLRSDRHNYYRTAKLNEISLPFRGNAGSMAAISLAETSSSDDTSVVSSQTQNNSSTTMLMTQSSAATDFSTLSNGDGMMASQQDTKHIYDLEDRFDLNFKRLRDELKKINYEQVDKEEKLLIKQMSDIEIQLQKHLPQTSTIDARTRDVRTTFELTNAEFELARNAAKRARQTFEKVKKERYDRFNALYEHVSSCIDEIYKSLTNSQAAVACLTAEDAEEPYRGGITYNCVAPGKRFQAMENLSGGEKTVAAICLLFALRSFKPAPFFLLDEVDAALDNTNIGKVADFIREQSASEFQCIVISLKEQFYSRADALVGIYPEPGDCITSHCLALDLNQFDERENIANTRD
ncbi:unnamed protein product [Rotaria socialis]|uniref:Structural maintenance of chromosomes protein n=2 Tax=Rotaria socialis TaxID=392032 RepID=A0A820D8C1_9BILA|nr:unnamed protein product [Rotaria socialis]CAF3504391.1 unnamed protein product [Rotaria socialis]CAF3630009.1 unnamed protein product [Rotaria socialis]CAF3691025.1 unnamed protein product [Rotaria socialis]CAF4229207.1 unnamed protein product [Rotaria socialis]